MLQKLNVMFNERPIGRSRLHCFRHCWMFIPLLLIKKGNIQNKQWSVEEKVHRCPL